MMSLDTDPDVSDAQHLYQALLAAHQRDDPEHDPASTMVALDLPVGTIDPVPGGLPASEHHITVVYAGKTDPATFADVVATARRVAATHAPLHGIVSGLGSFDPSESSDWLRPYFATPNVPGIEKLRDQLEPFNASEHSGFSPHVTLTYLPEGDPPPDPVPPTPVTFTHLSVHGHGQTLRLPFTGIRGGVELETRDWAKWHAEHPYIHHPRQKHPRPSAHRPRLESVKLEQHPRLGVVPPVGHIGPPKIEPSVAKVAPPIPRLPRTTKMSEAEKAEHEALVARFTAEAHNVHRSQYAVGSTRGVHFTEGYVTARLHARGMSRDEARGVAEQHLEVARGLRPNQARAKREGAAAGYRAHSQQAILEEEPKPKPVEPSVTKVEPTSNGNPYPPGSDEHHEYEVGYERGTHQANDYSYKHEPMDRKTANAHAAAVENQAKSYREYAADPKVHPDTQASHLVAAAGQEGQARAYRDHVAKLDAAHVTADYKAGTPEAEAFQKGYESFALGRQKARSVTVESARESADMAKDEAARYTGGEHATRLKQAEELGRAKAYADYADYYEAELNQLATPDASHHMKAVQMALNMASRREQIHEPRMRRALDQLREGKPRARVIEEAVKDAVDRSGGTQAMKEDLQAFLRDATVKLGPGQHLEGHALGPAYTAIGDRLGYGRVRTAVNEINKTLKAYDANAKLADDARKVDDWQRQIAESIVHGTPMPGDVNFGRRKFKKGGYSSATGAGQAYTAEHARQLREEIGLDGALEHPDQPQSSLESVSLRDIALEENLVAKGNEIAARIDANPDVLSAQRELDTATQELGRIGPANTGGDLAKDLKVGQILRSSQFSDATGLPEGEITAVQELTDPATGEKGIYLTVKNPNGLTESAWVKPNTYVYWKTANWDDRQAAITRQKEAQSTLNATILTATMEELRKERDFGGGADEHPVKGEGDRGPERIAKLRQALAKYPTEWIRRSMAGAGPKLAVKGVARRGHYSMGTISLTNAAPDAIWVHELGHHMQKVVDGLSRAEHVQLLRRAGHERVKGLRSLLPGSGYRSDEKSRANDFVNPYVGKNYGQYARASHEVFTMGAQSVIGGGPASGGWDTEGRLVGLAGKKADPELRALTLGALATLAPEEPTP